VRKIVRKMLWWYAVKMAFDSKNFKGLKRRWNKLPRNEREHVRKQFEAAEMRKPEDVYGGKNAGNPT